MAPRISQAAVCHKPWLARGRRAAAHKLFQLAWPGVSLHPHGQLSRWACYFPHIGTWWPPSAAAFLALSLERDRPVFPLVPKQGGAFDSKGGPPNCSRSAWECATGPPLLFEPLSLRLLSF